jgi:hypothetical protein
MTFSPSKQKSGTKSIYFMLDWQGGLFSGTWQDLNFVFFRLCRKIVQKTQETEAAGYRRAIGPESRMLYSENNKKASLPAALLQQ